MKKSRELPPMSKPHFDEEAVLAFASAGSAETKKHDIAPDETDGQVQIIVALTPKLFAALQKEAARKGRSAADMARKILAKHLDRD